MEAASPPLLVPRLRLGTHCQRGSAASFLGQIGRVASILFNKVRRLRHLQSASDLARQFSGVKREQRADLDLRAGGDGRAGFTQPLTMQGDHRRLHGLGRVLLLARSVFHRGKSAGGSARRLAAGRI